MYLMTTSQGGQGQKAENLHWLLCLSIYRMPSASSRYSIIYLVLVSRNVKPTLAAVSIEEKEGSIGFHVGSCGFWDGVGGLFGESANELPAANCLVDKPLKPDGVRQTQRQVVLVSCESSSLRPNRHPLNLPSLVRVYLTDGAKDMGLWLVASRAYAWHSELC